MVVIFLFILGISMGSFLNVLIDRLSKNESINGRSHCDFCKKTLLWADLIPLFSFISLKGRCRYCKAELSYQYPIIELLTGALFVFAYLNNPISNIQYQISNINPDSIYYLLSTIYYFFIVSSLIVIFFSDLKYGIIPDKIIFPAIIVAIVYLLVSTIYSPSSNDLSSIIYHLLSGFGSFLFFLIIYLLTKGRGMGLGDVKFSFVLGLILGVSGTILALYVAFLTGGIIGFILIIWKKKNLKTAVPFGPFLAVGFLISLFFSEQIIQYFLALI